MKKRLLCPHLPGPNRSVPLSESEAHHATRVLRMRDGEIVEAMDGKGGSSWVVLRTRNGPARLEFRPPTALSNQPKASPTPHSGGLPITLEVSILKGNAMEWLIEKAVELGAGQLIPIISDFTVVQTQHKGPALFQERWQKIADQALKQCHRLERMEIGLPTTLENHLKASASTDDLSRIWCDEASEGEAPYLLDWLANRPRSKEEPASTDLRILIGPEGGWSPEERTFLTQEGKMGKNQRIYLGPLILRAETAAIFATSLVSAFLRRPMKEHGI